MMQHSRRVLAHATEREDYNGARGTGRLFLIIHLDIDKFTGSAGRADSCTEYDMATIWLFV